jgi:hypothetical protein
MMVLTLVTEILALVYFVIGYLKASGAAAAIRAAANARFRGAAPPVAAV